MSAEVQRELATKAALEWIAEYTTIEVDPKSEDITSLPASAQLFVQKYAEILTRKTGVTSQSIEGLSLSYGSTDSSTLIWQLAQTLLQGYMKSQVRVFPAKRRW